MERVVTIGGSRIDSYLMGIRYGRSEEEIADQIINRTSNDHMKQGTALHEVVENGHQPSHWSGGKFISLNAKITLPAYRVKPIMQHAAKCLTGLNHEVKLPYIEHKHKGYLIRWRFVADGVSAGAPWRIIDAKFKQSHIDAKQQGWSTDYLGAYQWKQYCMAAGIKSFEYHVFHQCPYIHQARNGKVVEDYRFELLGVVSCYLDDRAEARTWDMMHHYLEFCERNDLFERIIERNAKNSN